MREGVGWASLTPCSPATGILLLSVSCCQIPRPPRRFLPGLQRAGAHQRNLDVVRASSPPAQTHAGAAGHRRAGRCAEGQEKQHLPPMQPQCMRSCGESCLHRLQHSSAVGSGGWASSHLSSWPSLLRARGFAHPLHCSAGGGHTGGVHCRGTPRTTRGSSCWPCCSPAP